MIAGEETLDPIIAALDRGWAVAVPDGENLGITGLGSHTFLAGRAAGHVALDLARAAQNLPEFAGVTGPVVLWGYADGGRAALWAATLHGDYAPELDLRGVAAGAVVTDPAALVEIIDSGPWSALGLAGLLGLSRAYHHLPLRHVFTADGHRAAQRAETLSAQILLAQYQQPLGHWCERSDPWNDPIWRYVLARENTTGFDELRIPVHLYHGRRDSIIPYELAHRLAADLRAGRTLLTWQEYDGDHLDTAERSALDVVNQLNTFLT
ncbi:lipase family protein [Nocardia sp. NPDC059246]|uniref:lipase family protein n=1 Tax=Nocardia sp. NPDC059246 TaxID=3346789 RepID=UPI00367D0CEB